MVGLIGKKLGMSQIFEEKGNVIPVTVVKAGPCYITQIKTKETDGYTSIQIGYEEVKENKLNKPKLGHLKKNNLLPLKILKEFKLKEDEVKQFSIGQKIDVSIFKEGEYIDVTGTSIGKGFQGVVKRHGFHGGPATHGSMSHRAPGSIGSTTFQRVIKGRRMAGHMGNERVTIQNLKIVKIIPEKNLILVKGSVPGFKNNYIFIKKAIKKKEIK